MKLRTGQEVRITFLDHVENGNAPIMFRVRGVIQKVDRTSITVAGWSYARARIRFDGNVQRWSILRSTIQQIDVMSPKPVYRRRRHGE